MMHKNTMLMKTPMLIMKMSISMMVKQTKTVMALFDDADAEAQDVKDERGG